MGVLEEMVTARLVPVVVLERSDDASPLGDALVAGGIPVAEVTFRTAAAPDAIRALAGRSDLLVGAGTVISSEQVDRAVDAGARFIVSPGLLPEVVKRAKERGVVIVPGAVTPSEIMTALSLGLDTLKFFPADVFGGAAAIKALGAPFRQVSFIPTGGVSAENLADYLSLSNVVAAGGSWMVKPSLFADGDFSAVTELSRAAVAAAKSVKEK
ncbi:bifunctional 4-hydroxy-2-oxoglutarate aldolase/2-dehydro-3-deoxy-phosphogluconate aldolase [Tessaracoccus sp. OS52]|uniref:bifunctional 4-hydroxy-2-oxoglutarate aldolase/2-dehydro-3-deoxy-phosphogluconate aldolase n=1 Tax=Tessaracoccus sp. OS52 TaxID=2886691 RepID=UPI001D1037A0|nr:bifunctional 4-hydroxy-2-oxoglutarate aldolase/2-dehydro-3-deoxy-phosphogluconate aldolase [Tessaracoccus sp. OS52]MCC2592731.1 bifunctional 4-hydroxy-2-oxoglutarate aldolase/2-dehydro-3-deoxy-phosphogluconate aldolase [Tessaracoccus sp. OS52]